MNKTNKTQHVDKRRVFILMGTGGMWSYTIGFMQYMRENYNLKNCFFSATSGSTMAAILCCQPKEVNGKKWHQETMVEGMKIIQHDYTFSRMYNVLGTKCKTASQNDGKWHERAKNKLFLPFWSHTDKCEKIISEWESTNDLVEHILGCCHIPLFIDGRLCCNYKNDYIYDIGLGGYEYYNPYPEAPFFYLGPVRYYIYYIFMHIYVYTYCGSHS